MPLTAKQRKELLSRSHSLKPAVIVNAVVGLLDSAVDQVRNAFSGHDLIKIRVAAETAPETDAVGAQLVARVPCELVRRVGRILILYRPDKSPPSAVG